MLDWADSETTVEVLVAGLFTPNAPTAKFDPGFLANYFYTSSVLFDLFDYLSL